MLSGTPITRTATTSTRRQRTAQRQGSHHHDGRFPHWLIWNKRMNEWNEMKWNEKHEKARRNAAQSTKRTCMKTMSWSYWVEITREIQTDVETYLKLETMSPRPFRSSGWLSLNKREGRHSTQCEESIFLTSVFKTLNVHLSSIAETSKLIHIRVSMKAHRLKIILIDTPNGWNCCISSMFAESILLFSTRNMEINSWRRRWIPKKSYT
jgi:hypothetical protein